MSVSASIHEEIQRAKGIYQSASDAVAKMLADARMGKALEIEHAMEQVEEIANSIHRHPHAFLAWPA